MRKKEHDLVVSGSLLSAPGRELRPYVAGARVLLVGRDTPLRDRVCRALTAGGCQCEIWGGDPDRADPAALAAQLGARHLMGLGDASVRRLCAAAVQSRRGETPPPAYSFWYGDFASAVTPSPVREPRPRLILCDTSAFAAADTPAFLTALMHVLRVAVMFDRGLFDMLYSSFDIVKLTRRAVRIIADIDGAGDNGQTARELLTFGEVGARLARAVDSTLTEGEALALGMLRETAWANLVGFCRRDFLPDLDGLITYLGLPRGMDCTPEELYDAFMERHDPHEALHLALPIRLGQGGLFDTQYETVGRILRGN